MTMAGIYAGSFDPVTLGHLDIIVRASRIVDPLIVVISQNMDKRYHLSDDTRLKLVKSAIEAPDIKLYGKVEAVLSTGLITEFAKANHVKCLIRGLRNDRDLAMESSMAAMNRGLNPDIETVFFTASPEVSHINATLVREVLKHKGDISGFVPKTTLAHFSNDL